MWIIALAVLVGFALIAWVLSGELTRIGAQLRLIARLKAGDESAKREASGPGPFA